MKFIEITPDKEKCRSNSDRLLSFQWDGTQDGYFEIWDKLPNTRSVSIFTRTLTIETHDGKKCIAEPGDWVIVQYPGVYTTMKNSEYVQKYGEKIG